MEREVGGGIGMGNTCKPMAVSFQCMTKSTTIKKIIIKKKVLKYLELDKESGRHLFNGMTRFYFMADIKDKRMLFLYFR